MSRNVKIAATILAAVAWPADAAVAADAKAGEALARKWCATCHVVAADQERRPNVAPPFSEIAKKPGFDAARLIEARKPPHPPIPPNLPEDQAADIAAYIATLAN